MLGHLQEMSGRCAQNQNCIHHIGLESGERVSMGGNEDPQGRTLQNLLGERVGRPEVKVAPATRVQEDALVPVRFGGIFAQLGVKRLGGLVFRVLREGRILVNKKLVNCRPIQLVNLRETTELLKRKSGDRVVLHVRPLL